jgi:hypothetical protein
MDLIREQISHSLGLRSVSPPNTYKLYSKMLRGLAEGTAIFMQDGANLLLSRSSIHNLAIASRKIHGLKDTGG